VLGAIGGVEDLVQLTDTRVTDMADESELKGPGESAVAGTKISRRRVLAAGAATVLASLGGAGSVASAREPAEQFTKAPAKPLKKRPQIAALVTEYRRYSHGQNIVDRFLGGYGWGGVSCASRTSSYRGFRVARSSR